MSHPKIITLSNHHTAKGAKPRLCVLIPFYNDDPSALIHALSKQASQAIEVLIYDDGTGNSELSKQVSASVKNASCPVTLFTAMENRGRSFGRNYLFNSAKSDWVLFLDADMMPMSESFLSDYLTLIEHDAADVIFGGFEVLKEKGDPSRELHRIMSLESDCASAEERSRLGPKNVASSNLCVKKTVLIAEGFDNGFNGWGWEDSEWAARISKSYRLLHAEIPALHLGLETTDTLLKRFKTSGENYARFTKAHPDLAKSLPLYNWVQKLKSVPAHKLCLLYTSPSPRDQRGSRMPSSA